MLVHNDLHPQNVILAADGPVIIDWEGTRLAVVRQRLADRNLLPPEAARLRKLLPADPAS